jgi:hypothetical protein
MMPLDSKPLTVVSSDIHGGSLLRQPSSMPEREGGEPAGWCQWRCSFLACHSVFRTTRLRPWKKE